MKTAWTTQVPDKSGLYAWEYMEDIHIRRFAENEPGNYSSFEVKWLCQIDDDGNLYPLPEPEEE